MRRHPVHRSEVRRLAPLGFPRVEPMFEEIFVVRIPVRAERDGGPAIERGGSRAHRRRDETVVLRMPHCVRDGDEGSTRARRDVATIPSPGERGEGGRR